MYAIQWRFDIIHSKKIFLRFHTLKSYTLCPENSATLITGLFSLTRAKEKDSSRVGKSCLEKTKTTTTSKYMQNCLRPRREPFIIMTERRTFLLLPCRFCPHTSLLRLTSLYFSRARMWDDDYSIEFLSLSWKASNGSFKLHFPFIFSARKKKKTSVHCGNLRTKSERACEAGKISDRGYGIHSVGFAYGSNKRYRLYSVGRKGIYTYTQNRCRGSVCTCFYGSEKEGKLNIRGESSRTVPDMVRRRRDIWFLLLLSV